MSASEMITLRVLFTQLLIIIISVVDLSIEFRPPLLNSSFTSSTSSVAAGRIAFGPSLLHASFSSTPQLNIVNKVPVHGTSTTISLFHLQSLAISFLSQTTNIPSTHLKILSAHTQPHSGTTHVYVRQFLHDLPIANADANVNLDRFGRVISFGESLYRVPSTINNKISWSSKLFSLPQIHLSLVHSTPYYKLSPIDAVVSLLHRLNRVPSSHIQVLSQSLKAAYIPYPYNSKDSFTNTFEPGMMGTFNTIPGVSVSPIPVSLAYIQVTPSHARDEPLKLVYSIELEGDPTGTPSGVISWVHAHVCANTGSVESIVDWVADSMEPKESVSVFHVYPIGVNDPDDGDRTYINHITSSSQSTSGWVSRWSSNGNNVVAEDNPMGVESIKKEKKKKKHRPHHKVKPDGHSRIFDFPIDLSKDPSTYTKGSISQLFYTTNALHDIFYTYGFTESAGNFQLDNLGHGGAPSDPIIAYAQDGSGYNNANFATPPDGKSGKMRMYVWNTVQPYRDGDLENGIIIHEFSHGVTTRLTGGRLNSGCLGWGEAGGMGEGWGDTWSVLLRMRNLSMASRHYGNWEMGKYANGGRQGIRKYPYSNDMKVNPSTYATLNKNGYWGVHAKGEVWAMILLEVYWNLIDTLGYTNEWKKSTITERLKYGNTLMMQIMMDGLQLQPCRPSFIDARDAMLQAERILTNGKYECQLWYGFAKRGLGLNAQRIPAENPWQDEHRMDGFDVPTYCHHGNN